jgi:hypothetical protein
MKMSYLMLLCGIITWVALIIILEASSVGLAIPIYPDPLLEIKINLMLISGAFTSCVTAYIGFRLLRSNNRSREKMVDVNDDSSE